MIVPETVGGPGILAKAVAIIRCVIVTVSVIIPVIEFAPAGPVTDFHPEIAVIIILVITA
jgi:hypothetical protein